MRLKILQVAGWLDPKFGGPPKVCVGQALELAHRGHEVSILSTQAPNELILESKQLEEAGIAVHAFPIRWPHQLRDAPELNLFLKRNIQDYDVAHIHCVWERCLSNTAQAARTNGIPYVVATHGMVDAWSMRKPKRYKKDIIGGLLGNWRMLRNASAIQVGSADESKEAKAAGLGGNHVIIPNGIHPVEVSPLTVRQVKRELYRRFPKLSEPGPVIIFFGRYHPKKGIDLLLRAFKSVSQEFPTAKVLCVGIKDDSEYLQGLRAFVSDAQLSDRVFITTDFVGPDAAAALALGTIYAHPAHQEGFSTAILDAMLMSLPLLLTDRCRMRQLESKDAGYIVSASESGLESGLRRMLVQSGDDLSAMGRAAHNWMRSEFTWNAVGDQLVGLYRELLESRAQVSST